MRNPRDKQVVHHVTPIPSAKTGEKVVMHSWGTSRASKNVLFLHGALSHSGRHEPMFDWLIKSSHGSLGTYALDLLGHGVSSGTRGHIEHFEIWVDDLMSAIRHLKNQSPLPLYLMGHSLGGLVILKALLEREIQLKGLVDGVVLCNPCIRPQKPLDVPKLEWLMEQLSKHLPLVRLPRIAKGTELLSDPHEANLFESDPLMVPYITPRMGLEIHEAAKRVRALSYFWKWRVCFLLSGEDVVVDQDATKLFIDGIDRELVKLIKYPEAKHELLHEKNHLRVWRDVLNWLEQEKT